MGMATQTNTSNEFLFQNVPVIEWHNDTHQKVPLDNTATHKANNGPCAVKHCWGIARWCQLKKTAIR